jgi:hypothetical protein
MEEAGDTGQDAFLATEAARRAFLTAVRRMTRGDHPLDVEHLIHLADQLCEVHHQSTLRPRRTGKPLPTEH